MKSCRDCVHAEKVDGSQLIRCNFPLPVWIKRELLSPLVAGELADHMNAGYYGAGCPTYQPRDERAHENQMTRADVLLRACYEILKKCNQGPYVKDAMEQTAFYDDAECDGLCLMDDIQAYFDEREANP